ncbi:MAG: hypothetical protein ACFCU3_11720 [Verrucomicrobiales bacterium]
MNASPAGPNFNNDWVGEVRMNGGADGTQGFNTTNTKYRSLGKVQNQATGGVANSQTVVEGNGSRLSDGNTYLLISQFTSQTSTASTATWWALSLQN